MQVLHKREVKKIATRQNRGEDSQFPILLNLFPLRRKERLQEFFWLHGSRRVVYAWKDSFPFEKRPIYRGKRNNELNTRACSSFWDYFFSFLNTLVCPPSFPAFFPPSNIRPHRTVLIHLSIHHLLLFPLLSYSSCDWLPPYVVYWFLPLPSFLFLISFFLST